MRRLATAAAAPRPPRPAAVASAAGADPALRKSADKGRGKQRMPSTEVDAAEVERIIAEARKDLPNIRVSDKSEKTNPRWPLRGLERVGHEWELITCSKYAPGLRQSILFTEKVTLTVQIPDLVRKYELSQAEELLMRQVVGPRAREAELRLTKHFRYGDPDWHSASLDLADALSEDVRKVVAACIGGVRPSVRLVTRLVQERRAEGLIAWLAGLPTHDKLETVDSTASLSKELEEFKQAVEQRRPELSEYVDKCNDLKSDWVGMDLWLTGGVPEPLSTLTSYKTFEHMRSVTKDAPVALKHAVAIEAAVSQVAADVKLDWFPPLVRAALCRDDPMPAVKFPFSAPRLAQLESALAKRREALVAKVNAALKAAAPVQAAKVGPAASESLGDRSFVKKKKKVVPGQRRR